MYRRLVSAIVLLFFVITLSSCVSSVFELQMTTENELKLAAIFPGVITDADYNTLGYIAITSVQADLGVSTVYSENVTVPDVDRVTREYIDDGYTIIFTHGEQFLNETIKLAKEFPNIYFVGETDIELENRPPNLWVIDRNFWVIDRNFYVGFYPLGAVAGKQSRTGKIGYIGGLTLPFSYAEVHAVEQAIADSKLNVKLKPVWVGNFNDPSKTRKLTEAMITDDIDVIIGSLNLGMFGLFDAVKNSNKPVWVTAKYTDKTDFAPDNYLTSVIYDFAGPLKDIVQNIENGENGGYYPLGFDTGVKIQPLENTSPELSREIEQIIKDIQTGKLIVEKKTTAIE